jgi:hypothetical protein
MKLLAILLWAAILVSPALAEKLVISGLVLDTSGAIDEDKPLGMVPVMILDANEKILKQTLTGINGRFHIEFDDESALTGGEIVRIDAAGYYRNPTSQKINLKRPDGMKLAYQGEFLLTNGRAIRENAAYREAVVKNAVNTQASSSQAERAHRVLVSLSALPPESKEIAFGSVKAVSPKTFSELEIVDKRMASSRELATELKNQGSFVVPLYEPSGKIRLIGPAVSEKEIDAILNRADQKGLKGNTVINDMMIHKK